MHPRLAFAALLTTSLVAVAVPAAAGSSDTSANPAGTATTSQPTSPNSTPSPATSADPGSTAATTADPVTADPTTAPAVNAPNSSPSSPDPAACLQSAGSNLAGLLGCITPTGSANPLTSIVTQLQAAAAGGGAPGLSPAPIEALGACVQSSLTAATPSAAAVEGCISTFLQSLTGASQTKCLDPILQGALGGVQALVSPTPNPTPLQTELTNLPGQLQALPGCLQGTVAAPVTTGTTTSSGGATTPATTTAADPTEATPVAATPTFTG